METFTKAPVRFNFTRPLLTMAAMAVALAAVVFTAGPSLVQASTKLPDACDSDKLPANPPEEFDTGRLVLFDAFWDSSPAPGVLHNNLCPYIEEVHESQGPLGGTTTTYIPTSTSIDVTKTVIQVDESYEYVLKGKDLERYPFIEDTETRVGVGSKVWWLRLGDNTATSAVEQASALQLGFSTARLDSAHWHRQDGSNPVAPLEYHYEAVREDDDPRRVHGHFYAFEPSNSTLSKATWDSTSPDSKRVLMWPRATTLDGSESTGTFLEWIFTKPGVYQLEVHLKGYVQRAAPTTGSWTAISEHPIETSEVVTYTFHVGPRIDLGVTLAGSFTENDTEVDYTVTATNSGPDRASNPMVQINLPKGLEYKDRSASSSVTHKDGTLAWTVGALNGSSPGNTSTLTFTAIVESNQQGRKFTADAGIRDLKYNEVETVTSNNTAKVTVTPASVTQNRNPMVVVKRQVQEHARERRLLSAPRSWCLTPKGTG